MSENAYMAVGDVIQDLEAIGHPNMAQKLRDAQRELADYAGQLEDALEQIASPYSGILDVRSFARAALAKNPNPAGSQNRSVGHDPVGLGPDGVAERAERSQEPTIARECRRLLDYIADALDGMQHPGGLTDLHDAENNALMRAVKFVRSTEINVPDAAPVVPRSEAEIREEVRQAYENDRVRLQARINELEHGDVTPRERSYSDENVRRRCAPWGGEIAWHRETLGRLAILTLQGDTVGANAIATNVFVCFPHGAPMAVYPKANALPVGNTEPRERSADTRFDRSVSEALNMGDGSYKP